MNTNVKTNQNVSMGTKKRAKRKVQMLPNVYKIKKSHFKKIFKYFEELNFFDFNKTFNIVPVKRLAGRYSHRYLYYKIYDINRVEHQLNLASEVQSVMNIHMSSQKWMIIEHFFNVLRKKIYLSNASTLLKPDKFYSSKMYQVNKASMLYLLKEYIKDFNYNILDLKDIDTLQYTLDCDIFGGEKVVNFYKYTECLIKKDDIKLPNVKVSRRKMKEIGFEKLKKKSMKKQMEEIQSNFSSFMKGNLGNASVGAFLRGEKKYVEQNLILDFASLSLKTYTETEEMKKKEKEKEQKQAKAQIENRKEKKFILKLLMDYYSFHKKEEEEKIAQHKMKKNIQNFSQFKQKLEEESISRRYFSKKVKIMRNKSFRNANKYEGENYKQYSRRLYDSLLHIQKVDGSGDEKIKETMLSDKMLQDVIEHSDTKFALYFYNILTKSGCIFKTCSRFDDMTS